MKIDLQSKLLRVLEERSVRRIGGKVDRPVDINIIASTNRNMKNRLPTVGSGKTCTTA